ncbi:protein-glutamate O-methyltransferase CheR [uncultured Methylobacterium sp.]|jgi:chemotaxis protein methyltransferase CheR|uniref:CheR family methyltransferase n=1 Tax=uncultured Methylobacterium sp. TaxID=157278 RepID=UPI002608B35B|nr:protein-glutamate O-methyltransferase CheR [uncultured Methylobacterium sp.]
MRPALPEPVTDADFARLREFVYRRTGIPLAPARRSAIDRRLAERMAATDSPSFAAYFAHLRAGPGGEAEELVNAITVNETYFFREAYQLRCLTAELMDRVVAARPAGAPLRIWSLPCSTGEEPYSIAIWLLEHWAAVDRHEIEIVGSDIDTRALAAAQAGLYGARALTRLPPDLVARYFVREAAPGAGWRLIGPLRGSVRFAPCNLMDAAAMRAEGAFDVVFCRNVLIYFDDASRRVAADHLYDSLRPGGFLCLGHSESMTRISPRFRVRRFADAVVYQRPPEGEDV